MASTGSAVRLTALLFLALVSAACSRSDDERRTKGAVERQESPIVEWDGKELPATGKGSDLLALARGIADAFPPQDQFETDGQAEARFRNWATAGQVGPVRLDRKYVLRAPVFWMYDAERQVLAVPGFSPVEQESAVGTYEGSNAFGVKRTVQQVIRSSASVAFFHPSDGPCNCLDGYGGLTQVSPAFGPGLVSGFASSDYEKKMPLPTGCRWADRPNRSPSDIELGLGKNEVIAPAHGDLSRLEVPLSSIGARSLPRQLELIAVVSFDTRKDLPASYKSLCLVKKSDGGSNATIDDPREVRSTSYNLNAKLHRWVLREPGSGRTLADFSLER